MKPLFKIILLLVLVFACTFIIIKFTGFITAEKITYWLNTAKQASPMIVAACVVALLWSDLLIAIPTLTVMILSGYFLGPLMGTAAAVSGLFLAGLSGYSLSAKYGDKLMRFLLKEQSQRDEAVHSFEQYSGAVILLSRALPILPEVSACLAGMTHMPLPKFLLLWLLSTVPYASIACYAGSVSTLQNPTPALFTAVGLTVFFWLAWLMFSKFKHHLTKITHPTR